MKKGTGYHLDMFLIGSFEIFCGLLGLPMLCAATGQWLFSRYVCRKKFAEVHLVTTGVTYSVTGGVRDTRSPAYNQRFYLREHEVLSSIFRK